MESIDEFDVDISKLWKWKKEVVIKDGDEILLKAYLRIPGDAEINRARVYALRESATLRKKLRDKEDFDRYAYILPEELISDEDLINYVVTLLLREEVSNITKEVDLPIPPKPDEDAPLEKHEEYQQKVDNWVYERINKINELTLQKEKEIREQVSKLPREELYKIYEEKSIDLYCENLVANLFVEQCIYYGLFKDPKFKVRVFDNFEEFANLPTQIKDKLKSEYNSLIISTEELKK